MNVLKTKRLLVCSGVWFGLVYAAQVIQEVNHKSRLACPQKNFGFQLVTLFMYQGPFSPGGGIRYESVQCAIFNTPFYL